MQRLASIGLILILPFFLYATLPAQIISIRLQPSPEKTRIIFTLTKKTFGKVTYLPKEKQLVIEFAHTNKTFILQNAKLLGSVISNVTSDQTPDGSLRFIFSVTDPVRWQTKFEVQKGSELINLLLDVIKIAPTETVKVKPQVSKEKPKEPHTFKHKVFAVLAGLAEAVNRNILAEDESAKTRLRARPSPSKHHTLPHFTSPQFLRGDHVFTVVIDAGHGGHDAGALGANGLNEKNVVLAIAKELADTINARPNRHAILTRSGDYFVSLRGRLMAARNEKADLFIAIHADAYFDDHAAGASVYALSKRGATSEAARWLAKHENNSELDSIELDSLKDRSKILRSVLIDLAQTTTIRDSLRLGNAMLDALGEVTSLHYSHVEQAPFVVLKSPDIPSILVETGFMTNPTEEKRLADAAYQHQLAAALAAGVENYLQK